MIVLGPFVEHVRDEPPKLGWASPELQDLALVIVGVPLVADCRDHENLRGPRQGQCRSGYHIGLRHRARAPPAGGRGRRLRRVAPRLGRYPRQLCSVSGASVGYQTPPVSGASAPSASLIPSKPTLAAKVGAARIKRGDDHGYEFARPIPFHARCQSRRRSRIGQIQPVACAQSICASQPEPASKRPLTISTLVGLSRWNKGGLAIIRRPCSRYRLERIDESIARYLAQLETADRQGDAVPEAKVVRLKDKIAKLREEVARLNAINAEMMKSEDKQISLTDPDARSMATSGKYTGIVGYNVQTAVDTKNHLIVAHEVTNVGTDRRQLSNIAEQARNRDGR